MITQLHSSPRWLTTTASTVLVLLIFMAGPLAVRAQKKDDVVIWATTGGGWRAMCADIGYAYVFQQAGLFSEDSTKFEAISGTSGGSWYATQLFYSQAFYNQTILANHPDDLYIFVTKWMETYANISSDVDETTLQQCDTSNLDGSEAYYENPDAIQSLQDTCYLLVQFNFDWAFFIQSMLEAASTNYGDAAFIHTKAHAATRIPVMNNTDMCVQATLVANSRIRPTNTTTTPSTTTAVYLGYQPDQQVESASGDQLFTIPLSAAWVVDANGERFRYGSQDKTTPSNPLSTYVGTVPNEFAWSDWEAFFLYWQRDSGTNEIDSSSRSANKEGAFNAPYGGTESTTVVQVASISSAAGGSASPLVASTYAQSLSIGEFALQEWSVPLVFRIIWGIFVGIGVGACTGFCVGYPIRTYWKKPKAGVYSGITVGVVLGVLSGLLLGFLYGAGSIVFPRLFNRAVGDIYQNSTFDKFAVCSQWPNPCGLQDGTFIDGWFIDNPALVINIAQYQLKIGADAPADAQAQHLNKTIKAIVTNTNQAWGSAWNAAQFLQYFSTYFNQNVNPGDFLWAPGYWAPFRSPQIFSEYVDSDMLDSLLQPIADSNMTTALLNGTTINNPSFGVTAGQAVKILLLNLNEDITTFVIGTTVINETTPLLANMTRNVAANQELLKRVREFVDS